MNFDRFLREAAILEGLEWRKYRRRSARHGVEQRIAELGLDGFAAYLDFLSSDPEERAGLADLMRVTVSRFFREREVWRTLAEKILPALFAERRSIRAWSAGCCGGEEPYTLAMVWLGSLAHSYPGRSIEIIASDIDEASLDRARTASYDIGSLREVPSETLARYFTRQRGRWNVSDEVREVVYLERRNLMSDHLPSGLDLVLCRYLAYTYYRGERLHAATVRLWESLGPGGVLMIGKKERLPPWSSVFFTPWPGCGAFYRRKG